MKDLSIAIVNWNAKEHLRQCLQSVRDTVRGVSCETVVVDNGSTDGSAEMVIVDFPDVRLVRNGANLGFSMGINQAIRTCEGAYILILNNDIVLLPGSVTAMLNKMAGSPEIGVLACQLLNANGTIQHFCRRLPDITTAFFENTFLQRLFPDHRVLRSLAMKDWPHDDFREVEQPPGCCLMIRRSVLDAVGLFDENMFLFFSDVDWCYRVKRAGFRIFFTPDARAVHYHGVATRKFTAANIFWHKDRIYYYRKHYGLYAVAAIKAFLMVDLLVRTLELLAYNLLGKIPLRETADNLKTFAKILAS